MFILPNKKPINMDKLEEAFKDFDMKRRYYLDTETGEVVLEGDKDYEKIIFKESPKFLAIPKLPASLKIVWMKKFADEMVPYDSPGLAVKLNKALVGENSAEKFMKILKSDKSGWIHGWVQWEADNLFEEIKEWFCGLPVEIEDDMSELDDDCPLCRMMKEGVNDMETLKKGFQEANAKQMVDNMFKKARDKDKKN